MTEPREQERLPQDIAGEVLSSTPEEVAQALHKAIRRIREEGPGPVSSQRVLGRVSKSGLSTAWLPDENGRFARVSVSPRGNTVGFREEPEAALLRLNSDGSLSRGSGETGQVSTMREIDKLPEGPLRDDASALFWEATRLIAVSSLLSDEQERTSRNQGQ